MSPEILHTLSMFDISLRMFKDDVLSSFIMTRIYVTSRCYELLRHGLVTWCDINVDRIGTPTICFGGRDCGDLILLYYEQQIKRELKRKHISGCRFNERLKAKTDG